MPKSLHPKSVKRRNRNFGVFRFWHLGPYGTCQFCPKKHIRFWLLSPNCPKSEWINSDLGCISFGLRLMSKNRTFCPIWPYGRSILRQKFSSKNGTFSFGFRTLSEYRTVWNWAKSWTSKNCTCSDFRCWLYIKRSRLVLAFVIRNTVCQPDEI